MWPFTRKFSLSDAFLQLRQELDTLKREVRNLSLDWSDYESRLRRRVASLARANQRQAEQDALREEATTPEASVGLMGHTLTPGQRRIQEQILARRVARANGSDAKEE